MIVSPLALAVLSCVAAADASTPPSAAPSAEVLELRERVAKLEGRINEMQAADGERWLSEERAADIRAMVQDVLADADTRASLQDAGATSGWEKGKGFFLQSADGNYKLSISGQIQFRWNWNHQENSPTDDDRYGFEMRRAKLFFAGHIVDPSWSYQVEVNGRNSDGGTFAEGENLWMQKDFGGGFSLRVGQFKPNYLREENVSARYLPGIERSQMNGAFTAGVAQGVQAAYQQDSWRAHVAIIDGFNTGGTGWSVEDNEFAATARVEFLPMGTWKSANDDTGFRGTENTLLFGLAGSYQKAEYGTGTNGAPPDFNNSEVEDVGLTADALFKSSGWSIAGSLVYRMLESDSTVVTPVDRDQIAFNVRGGFFLTDDIEIYGLYEWGDLDITSVSELSTLTIGVNKYFDRHNLKWSSDIGFGFNPVASQWAQSGNGWRADTAGEDGQVVFRTQLQLLF